MDGLKVISLKLKDYIEFRSEMGSNGHAGLTYTCNFLLHEGPPVLTIYVQRDHGQAVLADVAKSYRPVMIFYTERTRFSQGLKDHFF